jgi:WD40 repeat protein
LHGDDGEQIVSSSFDETIGFWDSQTGEPIGKRCKGHTAPIWSIAKSPDEKSVASASFDGTVRLWDAKTHEQIGQPLHHGDEVYSVAYSPDGLTLVSGGHCGGRLFIWDIREIMRAHKANGTILAFSVAL